MNLNDTFKLFANCIPVKGHSQSLICDLQNNNFVAIDIDLFEILTVHKNKSIKELCAIYKYQDLFEYFSSLKILNLGFFTKVPHFFPDIDLSFNECFLVSNAVIDYDCERFDIYNVIKQLDDLNCKHIEIRFYNKSLNNIITLLDYIKANEMMISSVGFVFQYDEALTVEFLLRIVEENNRISYLIVFNSPENKLIPSNKPNNMGYIINVRNEINNRSCGIISDDYFVTNIKSFTESLHHNSCLHKKISIDSEGNIRNCPSMPQSFGNIKDTILEEALSHPDFKKYWNLTKDSIEVCKDCEFRYICTDCRAYTERTHTNAEGLDTSKPLKCGYNPYTGEWEEWSTNPLKEKAIKYYGMEDLVKRNKF
ncbi:grasp-with-spasm system SPASM domain peptide maturase [Chryseobacterium taihuense]|uniref:SPASM domain peptide maturase, grasp-with-spasm system n=1 Tax=Chryseobacterium taihuense TaxID=1141221 RepID=A0ABY0QXK5_9FLAO|nr:grasp-with-spasm system SPASM domain peptide maturase [Chryseobacterium taihuense]SDM08436.1 SPASM domain peptide maturase, grasp-with-spasm system [Chryseobacterium taihuense]